MLNFLKQTRKFVNTKDLICIVIGNESCDLDSAVCALNLAYLFSRHENPFGKQFLPVLNVQRADYALKTEVKYVFRQHGIEEGLLTFRDELQTEFINNCNFILVDHHASPFAVRCLQIFDHRPRDQLVFIPDSCQVHLEPVGSCATLIAEQFINANCVSAEYKSSLAMLKDTIILDTVNFSETAKRATAKDCAVCEQLELILATNKESREQIFNSLVSARSDVSELSAAQLLRKDLKILVNKRSGLKVALPGFPISVQEFMQKPAAEESLNEFAEANGISVLLLMGLKVLENGVVRRDLGLIDINSCSLWSSIRDELMQSINLDLKLVTIDCRIMKKSCFYQQENIEKTRKHILPIVKNIVDSFETH